MLDLHQSKVSGLHYGCKRGIDDINDRMYRIASPRKIALAASVKQWCSPVEDQGDIGSCVLNSTVGNLELLEIKKNRVHVDRSRLFPYWNVRVLEHNPYTDSGCQIRDAIKVLSKMGTCPESLWPYDKSFLFKEPNERAKRAALLNQVTAYERCVTLQQIKEVLTLGRPVNVGIAIYESFEDEKRSPKGEIAVPKKGERLLGWHGILLVGFDTKQKWVEFKNSWGEGWGNRGFGKLPEVFFTDDRLSDDYWVIEQSEVA